MWLHHLWLAGDASEPMQPLSDAGRKPVPPHIFRAYDVRGLVGSEIDAGLMRDLGRAVGSEARLLGSTSCVVARDQRPSSDAFSQALVAGLRAAGCDVVDLGMAPTPVLYFAAVSRGGCSAAMVTASHNPAEYNGLKVVLAGRSAIESQIQRLRERILSRDFDGGSGGYCKESVFDAYVAAIKRDIAIARPLRVVVDCGHATASLIAARLYRALGCEVIGLDCDLDPARADLSMPDPSQPRNLHALGKAVLRAGADVGLGFDADGDRLGAVDHDGRFIAADRLLMLLAADVLGRRPGSEIVYDVKSSHHVAAQIARHGGLPVMWRSGHSFLKQKMRELGAPLGGELSGHMMFADRWNGFDDAFYAGARLLELLAADPRPSSAVFGELPQGLGTPELMLPLPEGEDRELMALLLDEAQDLEGVAIKTVDGLRVEAGGGWGLVRASHTRPGLMFRFEADDQAALDEIQDLFRRLLARVAPRLPLPF